MNPLVPWTQISSSVFLFSIVFSIYSLLHAYVNVWACSWAWMVGMGTKALSFDKKRLWVKWCQVPPPPLCLGAVGFMICNFLDHRKFFKLSSYSYTLSHFIPRSQLSLAILLCLAIFLPPNDCRKNGVDTFPRPTEYVRSNVIIHFLPRFLVLFLYISENDFFT